MRYTTKEYLKKARNHIENNLLTKAQTALIFAGMQAAKNKEPETQEFFEIRHLLAAAIETNRLVESQPAEAQELLQTLNRTILLGEIVQQTELANDDTPI